MNLIDIDPMKPGWGRVYQAGIEEIVERFQVKLPRLLVSMVGAVNFSREPVLAVCIDDEPAGILSPGQLLGMTDAVISYLRRGTNVIIHCAQGKSRSSYLDCAVHMRAMNIGYDEALALIQKQHPIAQPNSGFEKQLRSLEALLRAQS